MKKKHPKQHHPVTFVNEGEKVMMPVVEQRMLTAEGYRRRSSGVNTERPRSMYRGRRQGKGD
jgi:hypothetical protein